MQELLDMDEKTFFGESTMFLAKKTMQLVEGSITVEEYNQAKEIIEGVTEARKLLKPLPEYPNKGWLFPCLYQGSELFDKRWPWWSECLMNKKIEGELPRIDFNQNSSCTGVNETKKHIENILTKLELMVGCSSSIMTFVSWLLWGFGSPRIKEKNWSDELSDYLYKEFQLGKLQQHPYDYMAYFAQATRGTSRWSNPTAFFQTPPAVCEAMVKMHFLSNDIDITKSVCDPCAGTGTMLLHASNYSINIHAQEISYDLVCMLEVNAYLYMPWIIKPADWLKKKKENFDFNLDSKLKLEGGIDGKLVLEKR